MVLLSSQKTFAKSFASSKPANRSWVGSGTCLLVCSANVPKATKIPLSWFSFSLFGIFWFDYVSEVTRKIVLCLTPASL